MKEEKEKSSFRDPSGFLFEKDRILYRQINRYYKDNFEELISSGLYENLSKKKLLVSHQETDLAPSRSPEAYKIIQPQRVPFISYPYEWCFGELKDAALATLKIQKEALRFGMSLKDASAYNIQFLNGEPIFIDTLSFEKYEEGKPWIAYRQFCQHFLAPLALASYSDIRLAQLLRVFIDGIPLDLASRLLPYRTRFKLPLLLHIHLHSKSQRRYAEKRIRVNQKITKTGLIAIIDNLKSAVENLNINLPKTEWGDYYEKTNYSDAAFSQKEKIIKEFLRKVKPSQVWDLGANTGVFSRIPSKVGILTISSDIDPVAVEKNYQDVRKNREKNILPLWLDLTNPSPAIGWQNKERNSLIERGPADLIMALALIHHLAISNNLPLSQIVDFLARIGQYLIAEFVPKSDSQVKKLLFTREDIFPEYNLKFFEQELEKKFSILDKKNIVGSERTLILAQRK